ncbi:MAG: hypothetical protein Q7J32_13185 [Sphingomonadaceae bacterium]|nr:hypothetical protein [Sphingomonadaceae bacterium]
MADRAILAVVALAPVGKPFQPVIFLGRLHEASDVLGTERLPEPPFPALLGAAVAVDPLAGLTAGPPTLRPSKGLEHSLHGTSRRSVGPAAGGNPSWTKLSRSRKQRFRVDFASDLREAVPATERGPPPIRLSESPAAKPGFRRFGPSGATRYDRHGESANVSADTKACQIPMSLGSALYNAGAIGQVFTCSHIHT